MFVSAGYKDFTLSKDSPSPSYISPDERGCLERPMSTVWTLTPLWDPESPKDIPQSIGELDHGSIVSILLPGPGGVGGHNFLLVVELDTNTNEKRFLACHLHHNDLFIHLYYELLSALIDIDIFYESCCHQISYLGLQWVLLSQRACRFNMRPVGDS